MSALDHQALATAAAAKGIDIGTIKALVAPFIWQFAKEHEDMTVFSIKKRILGIPLSYTAHVRDCYSLITLLVGPDASA